MFVTPALFVGASHLWTRLWPIGLLDAHGTSRTIASVTLNGSTAGTYLVNGLEQRVAKTVGSATTHFIFDRLGHLLAEADGATGATQREYIWLDDLPVAMVDDTGASPVITYIHTDHLGTPQKITDSSMNLVWDGVFDPFGNASSITGSATMNLRFLGQYSDTETGLSQNWLRDYDPSVGRYIQSDLLGLLAGTNTYQYADGNPVRFIDPLALDVWIEGPNPNEPAGHQSINVEIRTAVTIPIALV